VGTAQERLCPPYGDRARLLPTTKKNLQEIGYKDVEFYIWAGLFAQSNLPAPIMTRLREATAQAVRAPEVVRTFDTAGSPIA
jgi:tripartite-type tricarboxylate transporter receptor subunit TctC